MASKGSKTRKPPVITTGSSGKSSSAFPVTPKRSASTASKGTRRSSKSAASGSSSSSKPRYARSSSGSSRSSRRQRSGGGSFFGKAFKWLFVLGLWVGIAGAAVLAYYATELPDITKSATFERQSSITVLAANGDVVARYGEMKGNTLSLNEMPPHLVHAVIATEDRRFYHHFGIDVVGLLRAMVVNVQAGGVVQGGSTITQQLAKNLFLSHERTLKRKIQEAMLAVWLEHQLTKDEILSAYLNRVYLGSGTYGVDAAAQLYFDKDVKDISLRESAIIAGLLKAPSRYSPRRNPNLANERADVVLQAMADAGYITKEEAKGISNPPPLPPEKPGSANAVRYYTDWVVDGLDDLIGTPEKDMIVQTTLVTSIQTQTEKAIFEILNTEAEEKNIGQAAMVVMAHDGAVLALVGGRDYNKSQFNRITQAKRQPGSSFKPLVYLTALERGWSPDTEIMDEPITEGRYRPANFGNKYYGQVTLDTALTYSLNTTSYNIAKQFGPDAIIDTARRAGIISPMEPDLSLALGSYAVSPLELTTAYAAIANGGHAVFPYAITKIKGEDGKVYYERPAETVSRRVIEPLPVMQLQMMMQNVVQYGTGQNAKMGFAVGGKTGTSQESRDAWFAGYTDRLVAAAWVGNDDNSPTKAVTGGSVPARIWARVIGSAQGSFNAKVVTPLADQATIAAYDHGNYDEYGNYGGYTNESSGSGFGGLIGRLLGGGNAGGEASASRQNNSHFNQPSPARGNNQPFDNEEQHQSQQRYNN